MAIRLQGTDKESTLHQHTPKIGTYYLTDNSNLYEPQRSNNFEFVVTDIDNIVKAGFLGTESNARIANAQEVLRLSVASSAVPHFTQSVITIKRGNTAMKFAGAIEFASGKFSINDYIGADSKAVLMAWQNLSGDVATEKVGLASDYKKDAYLIEYTPEYQPVRKWILKGCWISGLSEGDYNHEDNGKRSIEATIEYDRAFIDTSEDF